jgi:hypothetical protein
MDKILFDALASKTNMREKSISMAKKILLDGESFSAVAREYGVSRQRARQAANRITRQEKIICKMPDNWHVKTIVLPHEWVDVIGYIDSKVKEKEGVFVRVKRGKPELDGDMVTILAGILAGK